MLLIGAGCAMGAMWLTINYSVGLDKESKTSVVKVLDYCRELGGVGELMSSQSAEDKYVVCTILQK